MIFKKRLYYLSKDLFYLYKLCCISSGSSLFENVLVKGFCIYIYKGLMGLIVNPQLNSKGLYSETSMSITVKFQLNVNGLYSESSYYSEISTKRQWFVQ